MSELPAGRAARAPAARLGHLSGQPDAAGDRSGALGPARQRRPRGRPDARDGGQPRARRGDAGPRAALRRRRGRDGRAHAQGAGRVAADPRPGRPARAGRGVARHRALPHGTRLRAARRARGGAGADRADAQRPADVQPDHRGGPVPPRGAADGGRQPRRPVGAQPPDRRRAADRQRRAPGAARGGRRRPPPAPPVRGPGARARHRRHRLEDPEPGQRRDGEGPARVGPAPAAQGDPGRAGRAGPVRGGGRRAARAARGARAPGRTSARRSTASCRGSRSSRRRPPSTA